MQRERVALEQSTNELNGRAKALDRWLSANESKMPPGEPTGRAALMLDLTVQVMPGSLSYEGKLPQQQYPMETVLHRLIQCSRQSSQPCHSYGRGHACTETVPCAGEISADDAVVPADALSAQALAAQAEDLALEDAMYELDRALPESTQPIEVYLKQV